MPTMLPTAANQNGAPRRLTGRSVLLLFCGFFGVIFAMNGLFMFFAFSTFGGVDAAGAYRKNFLLTKDIVAAEQQTALGWSVSGRVVRSGKDRASISVIAKDRDGQPVDIKSMQMELRRPADKRQDAAVTVQRIGMNHFRGDAKGMQPGQWNLLITLLNNKGERFHSRNRIILKQLGTSGERRL